MKTTDQRIISELQENPDVRLVLEIATRSRELQERATQDVAVPSPHVTAVPTYQQRIVG